MNIGSILRLGRLIWSTWKVWCLDLQEGSSAVVIWKRRNEKGGNPEDPRPVGETWNPAATLSVWTMWKTRCIALWNWRNTCALFEHWESCAPKPEIEKSQNPAAVCTLSVWAMWNTKHISQWSWGNIWRICAVWNHGCHVPLKLKFSWIPAGGGQDSKFNWTKIWFQMSLNMSHFDF